MTENDKSEFTIMLKNVRVSFPALFQRPRMRTTGEEGSFGARLLLDPENPDHAPQIEAVKKLIMKACKDSGVFEKVPPPDRRCLRSGNDSEREEYQGMILVSANNDTAPYVFDGKRKWVQDESRNPIYSGCYVDAQINIWVQNNSFGKRVNAQLRGIAFAGDGKSFDGSYVPYEDVAQAFGATGSASDASDMGFDDDSPTGGSSDEFSDDIPL